MIRYVTAKEISDAYRRPIATVYRLASTDRWKRSGDGKRPVLYDVDDVERTMARLAESTRLT